MNKYTKRMAHSRKLIAFEIQSKIDEGVPSIFKKRPTLKDNIVTVYSDNGTSTETLDSYLQIAFSPSGGEGDRLWKELFHYEDQRKKEGELYEWS